MPRAAAGHWRARTTPTPGAGRRRATRPSPKRWTPGGSIGRWVAAPPRPEDSFVVPPPDHDRALPHAERRGWSLARSYHSHPRGGAAPSDTDIAKALDPGWFYLVVGLGAAPRITGWRIRAGVATEVELG